MYIVHTCKYECSASLNIQYSRIPTTRENTKIMKIPINSVQKLEKNGALKKIQESKCGPAKILKQI